MQRILASLALLCLMGAAPASSVDGPPPPERVMVVVDETQATVLWSPPLMPPDDLLAAQYEIYGLPSAGPPVLLTTEAGTAFSAQVTAGYENYGVRVVLDGEASLLVHACATIKRDPPSVDWTCRAFVVKVLIGVR